MPYMDRINNQIKTVQSLKDSVFRYRNRPALQEQNLIYSTACYQQSDESPLLQSRVRSLSEGSSVCINKLLVAGC